MASPEIAADTLIITLFGPMRVRVQGSLLPPFRSRKALWALALLTLRHERPVEREWLAATLWPDVRQEQAFANLRPVLSELRRALGEQGTRLQSPGRQTLVLELSGAEVDVIVFDTAIKKGRLSDLEQAVALYGGPLLEGCQEEWVGQERASREQHCLHALQKLGEAALKGGDYAAAILHFQRAASLDAWSDAARRGWMEALARNGDRNAALQVYREFLNVLKSDPTAVPDEQTTVLYQRLRTEARHQASAPAAVKLEVAATPRVTGYLPHALTDLVGREDERLEVAERLRRSRLVTLTGMGGIGKTRLAMEVAKEGIQEYPDGVWLVALEALSEGKMVAQQIASVLGLREEAGRTAMQSVTAHLRSKRLLLVLDNCEHLLDASAQVIAHLLQECAEVKFLATSREAMGIVGELAWAVPSLTVPDPEHLPSKRATLKRVLMGYESVQLFVERAQAVQNTFALTADNAPAVAQVCAQLEGIPLAIELAAARVKALTVEQIAERLHNELSLLTGGSRVAQARQQTLRATLDWSYKLLSGPEQALLERLSVFAGGWSLAAAEAVCPGGGIETWEIVDLLTSLANKSLIVFEERAPEQSGDVEIGRYRLLEMVRQYAAERLEASGAAAQSKARHRDFFLALAQEAEPNLKGSEQQLWLQHLGTESDNLRAAVAWCGIEKEGGRIALQIVGALWQFWELRGYYNEGRTSLAEALGRDGSQERTGGRAKALYAAGVFAFYQGDYGAAQTLCAESLEIFRELGNKQGTAWSLKDLGRLACAQGDYKTAQSLYEESLAISQELDDRQGSGWTLNDLGNLAGAQGNYGAARTFHAASLAISQNLRDTEGIAWCLHHLGGVARMQGDYGAAQTFHKESLAIFRELGIRQGSAWALNYLGNVACARDDYERALMLFEEGLTIFRELGNKQGMAWSFNDMGKLAEAQGDYKTARSLHKQGINIQRELRDRRGVAAGLRNLIALMPPASEKAVRLWGASEALRESIAVPLPPHEQVLYDRKMAQVRTALGEEVFSAAWEEGRVLTMDQAAAYALEEEETNTSYRPL